MRQDLCDVTVLLDRSGSMQSIQNDMEGGFNALMEDQRRQPGECRVTLQQFDGDAPYEIVYEARPVAEVPPLVLRPRGMTPLLDALGFAINRTGERLAALPADHRPAKVVFVVITDGLENASREFSRERIAEMTKHQQELYGWQFIYLGANQDAIQVAQGLGMRTNSAGTYRPDAGGVLGMSVATSRALSDYRAGRTANTDLTDEERSKMGGQ